MSRKTFNHNQLSLPFGEKGGRAISYEDKSKAFWLLVSISLLSLSFYVYAVNATAHHIAIRQNLEREVASLTAEIGTLEFASIGLRNAITMEKAAELGFSEVRRPLYVSRTPNTALTLNTER